MNENLKLTRSELNAAKTVPDLFENDKFSNNFARNYAMCKGETIEKGHMIFEREKILFLTLLQENKQLQSATKESLYTAFIELAVSGQTLADGCAYVIPYGKGKGDNKVVKAQFQIGWKGRLNQMYEIPEVQFVDEPQVVYENDEFEYELGENPKVLKHKPVMGSGDKKGAIIGCYLIVDTRSGKKTYIMDADEVFKIRDTYSQAYKYWKSKDDAGTLKGWEEKPFWVTSEAEAVKKTLVKRAWKYLPKTKRQINHDQLMAQRVDHEEVPDQVDEIDFGLVNEDEPVTDNHAPEATIITDTTGIDDL